MNPKILIIKLNLEISIKIQWKNVVNILLTKLLIIVEYYRYRILRYIYKYCYWYNYHANVQTPD